MKPDIHPKYHHIPATCSCGNVIEKLGTTSSKDSLHLDVCSACHPFYTKQQRTIDTGGRVKQFQDKYRRGAAG